MLSLSFQTQLKKKKKKHLEGICTYSDSTGHFNLNNSLEGWKEQIAVCAGWTYKHTLYQLLWPRKKPVKACQWWCIFCFLGISLCSSTLTAILEEQEFVLRELVSSSMRTCCYCGDGFLVTHNTTTSCNVACKDHTRDNMQLEALYV